MECYKTVEVPATTRQELTHRECDFCGVHAKPYGPWKTHMGYDVDETEIEITVKHRAGQNYPEGGSGDKFECDICPDCFRNILVPFLKERSKNAIDYEEWDW